MGCDAECRREQAAAHPKSLELSRMPQRGHCRSVCVCVCVPGVSTTCLVRGIVFKENEILASNLQFRSV